MGKTYFRTFKRVWKRGGIVYARRTSKTQRRFKPNPRKDYDLSWLEGVEVSIQIIGPRSGEFYWNELYLVPTHAEKTLCGFEKNEPLIPLRTDW